MAQVLSSLKKTDAPDKIKTTHKITRKVDFSETHLLQCAQFARTVDESSWGRGQGGGVLMLEDAHHIVFTNQQQQLRGTKIRKLENFKAVAVQNSLLERFSAKFRRCWKILPRFSGSTKCYPCQLLGTFRQGKRLLDNWPRLRERCWIFASHETATTFLSSSEKKAHCPKGAQTGSCGLLQ